VLGKFPQIALLLAVSSVMSNACGGTVPLGGVRDVTRRERVWVDASRRTPPNGTFPGAPTRTLRTLIWQPTAAAATPVVVMAHGFGGLPESFDAFAGSVAAAGFIVAAPEFPLTNRHPPGGRLGVNDLNNQPGDLSFVITQLLQVTSTNGDPLHGRILADDIAVIGQSLGAATVIGLTRKNCCRDVRVRASVLSAAPLLPFFGPDPLSASGPPTLILQGTADTTVGFATAAQLYSLIAAPRFLVGLNGAEHSDALESQVEPPIPARDAGQRATVAFLNAVFRGRAAEFDVTLAALAAQGNDVQADPGWTP
jgi:predicted dienelactone hydrolase